MLARHLFRSLLLGSSLGVGLSSLRADGFTELNPKSAGILFTNSLPPNRIIENFNRLNGSGVAAGDFDGDGLCDLYFCAIAGTNALYRNLGNWRFEDVTDRAGVGCPNWNSTGSTFADFDGDGDLDLFVTTLGTGVHLFRNDSGRFQEITSEAGLSFRAGSTSLALADIDGDGDLDLYVANYGDRAILRAGGRAEARMVNGKIVLVGPNADRLRVIDGRIAEVGEPDRLFRNDRGVFHPLPWNSKFFLDEEGKPKEEPWDFGLAVVMRDFNGDGAADIYVCNDFETPDRFWLNDGSGHFRLCPRLALRKQSFSSMGIDLADIDRDGFFDFFVTEMRPSEHARRLRSISGAPPFFALPGDIDSRPDVARNTLFWNRGNQTYAEIAEYAGVAATDWSWQPLFLDVDLDGLEDLLVLNGALHDVQDRDVLEEIRTRLARSPDQTRANLLLYPPYRSSNAAFRNQGDHRFAQLKREWGFDSKKICQGVALADLDNDGDLDLVSNALDDTPLLCRNDASGDRIAVRLKGRAPNTRGIGALISVRSQGLPEQKQEIIAGGRYLSGDDAVRSFAVRGLARIEVRWPRGQRSILEGIQPNRTCVVDEDSALAPPPAEPPRPVHPLLVDRSRTLAHRHFEKIFDDYAYQPLLPFQLSQRGPGLAAFDLDGDGTEELIVGTGAGGRLGVFRLNSTGSFEALDTSSLPVSQDDLLAMCAWFGPAGKPALLVAQSRYESRRPGSEILALRMDRTTGHLSLTPFGMDVGAVEIGSLAAADFDGDGDLDLFVAGHFVPGAYPAPVASQLWVQTEGKLEPDPRHAKLFQNLGAINSALWIDLDHDGFSELLLAQEWGPLRLFHNDRGLLREVTDEMGLGQWSAIWTGLASGDFDGDGNLDFVACNWGENTGWTASPEHPFTLFWGSSPPEGVKIIETEFVPESGIYSPVRALNVLSRAFPALAHSFSNNASFASASMEGFLKAIGQPLRQAKATSFQTGVFLNRTNSFVRRPLPFEAQLSPAFNPLVLDLNGDGIQDLCLTQNFYAFRPELARADAGCGLVLLGRGDGTFTALNPEQSGLQIFGEQRGAVAADFDGKGRLDIVIGQSGGPVCLLEPSNENGIRVRLNGGPANPLGVGALLKPRFASGDGPVLQTHAGSGWLSQNSLLPAFRGMRPETIQVIWPGGKSTETRVDSGNEIIVRLN